MGGVGNPGDKWHLLGPSVTCPCRSGGSEGSPEARGRWCERGPPRVSPTSAPWEPAHSGHSMRLPGRGGAGRGWELGLSPLLLKWAQASHLPRGRLQTQPWDSAWVLQRLVALPGGENCHLLNSVPFEGRPVPLSGGMAGAQGSKQELATPQRLGRGLWTPSHSVSLHPVK